MQMIPMLVGLTVFSLVTSQALPLFSAAQEHSEQRLITNAVQIALRRSMIEARATQQTLDVELPPIRLPHRIRTLVGAKIRAYPDGTVSPGELRLCSRAQATHRVVISSLGRTRTLRDQSTC